MEQKLGIRTPFEVLMSPTRFFKSVKKDEGYIKPWVYALIIISIYMAFIMIYAVMMPTPENISSAGLFKIIFVFLMLIFIIFMLALTAGMIFIGAGITHLFLMIVGSEKGYLQTFKLVCYSYTALLFSAPLILLNLMPDGEMASFILSIPFGIYSAVISVYGAMALHDISAMRAVSALILIPLGILMLLFVLFLLFLAALIIPMMSSDMMTGAVTGLM